MSYSNKVSQEAVQLLQVALTAAPERSQDTATLVANTDLVSMMPEAADRIALIASRGGKEWKTQDLAVVEGDKASGTFTISGNAAGDGIVQLDIDGVNYEIVPTVGNTPAVTAGTMVGLVNGGSTHTATNIDGVVTVTSVESGIEGNSVVFTDESTDSTQTAVAVSPTGGTDDSITGTTRLLTTASLFQGSTRV